ncbi:MAG TPA: AsmA family protein, partial [Acetobacteraceae bacterium]|nr:AsmA family protein [Acetobacteraceae bacterium]
MPLDNLVVHMDIVNGAVDLHPVSFGVGTGKILGNISLTPEARKQILAKANIDFLNVNVSRLMAATHVFHGAGTVGGRATLDSTGNSIASWAANGTGGLALTMQGGNLSALLVALSGLQFGNAVISALGLPKQTNVRCFIGDFALNHGIIDTRTLLLDTGTALVNGGGTVDLRTQTINYFIRSRPKHFSIGSLPAPIKVTGLLKKPSIGPAKKPLIVRGGAAAVLGVIAAPLALLPTIQLGVKDPHVCHALLQETDEQIRSGKPGRVMPVTNPAQKQAGKPDRQPVAKPAAPARAMHVSVQGHVTTRSLNERELQHVGGK